MERIAILDHASHTLYVEDISDEDLEQYNDSEEEYIKDNYTFEGEYSWEYIKDTEYISSGSKMPIEIDFYDFKDVK